LTDPPSSFARDQSPSAFAEILRSLCERTGAECAALVDDLGETVDYWGLGDPFMTRLVAAEFAIVLMSAVRRPALGSVDEVFVRSRDRSFLVRSLPDGYALVLDLPRRPASVSRRAVLSAVRALSLEAGFVGPLSCRGTPQLGAWRAVRVREEPPNSRRPAAVDLGDATVGLDIIGRVALSEEGEQGYRVRLETGQEGTLVREPLGHWYLDEES
jgi:hypothetical protein